MVDQFVRSSRKLTDRTYTKQDCHTGETREAREITLVGRRKRFAFCFVVWRKRRCLLHQREEKNGAPRRRSPIRRYEHPPPGLSSDREEGGRCSSEDKSCSTTLRSALSPCFHTPAAPLHQILGDELVVGPCLVSDCTVRCGTSCPLAHARKPRRRLSLSSLPYPPSVFRCYR